MRGNNSMIGIAIQLKIGIGHISCFAAICFERNKKQQSFPNERSTLYFQLINPTFGQKGI